MKLFIKKLKLQAYLKNEIIDLKMKFYIWKMKLFI